MIFQNLLRKKIIKKNISFIYEINTRLWLKALSIKHRRKINLNNIPEQEIENIRKLGFDSVWLMGIWMHSEKGKEIAYHDDELRRTFLSILPDLKQEDISSSPYAIPGYKPDPILTSEFGLLRFKKRLNSKGINLILDFVPNHVAIDHPWVKTNPDYFIRGTQDEWLNNEDLFFSLDEGNTVIAYGKDPYFPSWSDVAQLNYYNPELRSAMAKELSRISKYCDGLRCDMAMLILKDIQKKIWNEKVFNNGKYNEPKDEFWQSAINEVKKINKSFIFIAEVYWKMEKELINLGFDYVYDKECYDILKKGEAGDVRKNLLENGVLTNKRLRFIENHDEDRVLKAFGKEKSKAAAGIICFAKGARLFYQGQLKGSKIKLPVQMIKWPEEEIDKETADFYDKFLVNLKEINEQDDVWILLNAASAWYNNFSHKNIFAFFNEKFYLAVINYSETPSQGYLKLQLPKDVSKSLIFKNILGDEEYQRDTEKIVTSGLYLDLPAFKFQLFKIKGL